jgi:hypothetical protein
VTQKFAEDVIKEFHELNANFWERRAKKMASIPECPSIAKLNRL